MEIPEIEEQEPNDGTGMLVAFPAFPTAEGEWRHPINLEDLYGKPELKLYKFSPIPPGEGEAEATCALSYSGDLYTQLEKVDRELRKFGGRVFSIHTNSVLSRLVHLYELKTGNHLAGFHNKMIGDLVSEFHGGIILTYAERMSFNGRQVAEWMDLPSPCATSMIPMIQLARLVIR